MILGTVLEELAEIFQQKKTRNIQQITAKNLHQSSKT